MLNVNTDKDDQSIFIHFINTIYTVKHIIMDYIELQKKYGNKIKDIMNIAVSVYKIKVYDIRICPHSSRLYRIEDKTAKLNIFNEQDKESNFKVVMAIIDGIYHFIFHIFKCGLRVVDIAGDDDIVIDDNKHQNDDELYDPDYAIMSARISKTRNNTQRFDRINTSNKFNITNITKDTDINISNDKSDGITYLDSIYKSLTKAGIDQKVIDKLSNYVKTELFDTEGLEIDLQIEKGGNIETIIDNKNCIDCIKNIFNKANSFVFFTFYYTFYI